MSMAVVAVYDEYLQGSERVAAAGQTFQMRRLPQLRMLATPPTIVASITYCEP